MAEQGCEPWAELCARGHLFGLHHTVRGREQKKGHDHVMGRTTVIDQWSHCKFSSKLVQLVFKHFLPQSEEAQLELYFQKQVSPRSKRAKFLVKKHDMYMIYIYVWTV